MTLDYAAAIALAPLAQASQALGYDLTMVLVFAVFGIGFVVVTVAVLSRILRPRAVPADEPAKEETYECGEPAIGSSWVRFDIRFYTVALVFLIFDVEVLFLYPWAVVFRGLRQENVGAFVFAEMAIFIVILLTGFIYCWRRGDLDWVKSKSGQEPESAAAVDAARSGDTGAPAGAESPAGAEEETIGVS